MDRWPLTSPQENSVFLLRFQREWPFLQTKNSTRSENWLYWTAMTPLCRRSLVQSSNAALLLLGSLPSLQTCAAPMVLTGPLSLLSLILNINTKKKPKNKQTKKTFSIQSTQTQKVTDLCSCIGRRAVCPRWSVWSGTEDAGLWVCLCPERELSVGVTFPTLCHIFHANMWNLQFVLNITANIHSFYLLCFCVCVCVYTVHSKQTSVSWTWLWVRPCLCPCAPSTQAVATVTPSCTWMRALVRTLTQ